MWIQITPALQKLELLIENQPLVQYPVSLAANGLGEQNGSECTPRGWHQVRAKIGQGMPANTVFKARRPTGEFCSTTLYHTQPARDWILTRILWLSGLEKGKNRFGSVDTMRRYIYIHGTPDDVEMGKPGSRGCVRMRNKDIIELFNLIHIGTRILILDH